MKRAPLSYRASCWSRQQLARFREIERDFHTRGFGEELARINLDLTIDERRRYLEWMRSLARKHGVKTSRGGDKD